MFDQCEWPFNEAKNARGGTNDTMCKNNQEKNKTKKTVRRFPDDEY